MTSTPSVSRNTFSASKNYFGQRLQDGQRIYAWDLNETSDELSWQTIQSLRGVSGSSGRIWTSLNKGFKPTSVGTLDNISFTAGFAIVNGRVVHAESAFNYTDYNTNYINRGSISTLVPISVGVKYRFNDASKAWTLNHSLANCRLIMASGASSGQEYLITGSTGQTVSVTGDMSEVVAGDEYIIAPPALTALGALTPLFLVTWWEDIDEVEDGIYSGGIATITDPISGETPSHRRQLRWCIHVDWAGTSTATNIDGHIAIQIATLNLADAAILSIDIVDGDYILALDKAYDVKVDTEAGIGVNASAIATINDELDSLNAFKWNFDHRGYIHWTIDGTSALMGDLALTTQFLSDSPTTPYRVEEIGGNLINSIVESSYIYIDLASTKDAGEGNFYGDFISWQDSSTSTQVNDSELAVLAIHAENGSPANITRAFPIGTIPVKQGLDFVIYDSAGTKICKILPGQITIDDVLYQNVSDYTIPNCSTITYHVSGAVPYSAWTYLYAIQQSNTRRDLKFQWDTEVPLWNGRHPTLVGACVGITFFSGTGYALESICRNNRIQFYSDGAIQAWAGTVAAYDSFTLAPPLGAAKITFKIRIDSLEATERITVAIRARDTVLSSTGIIRGFSGVGAAILEEDRLVHLPGGYAEYAVYILDVDGVASTVNIFYDTIEFNPTYMPDRITWED